MHTTEYSRRVCIQLEYELVQYVVSICELDSYSTRRVVVLLYYY